jgi:hypothetical protein
MSLRWSLLGIHAIPALLSVGVLTQPALAQLHYECKADAAVGFAFDESARSWRSTNFQARGRYIIRQLISDEMQNEFIIPKGSTWGVFTDQFKTPRFGCPEPKTSVYESGLHCGLRWDEFEFDPNPLRYQTNYLGGYVDGRDNNEDTPAIEIGRCKAIYGT